MDDGVKRMLDDVYAVGFKNGQIAMRNKVLKKINRDWTLVTIKPPMDLIMKVLKDVSKLKITAPLPENNK